MWRQACTTQTPDEESGGVAASFLAFLRKSRCLTTLESCSGQNHYENKHYWGQNRYEGLRKAQTEGEGRSAKAGTGTVVRGVHATTRTPLKSTKFALEDSTPMQHGLPVAQHTRPINSVQLPPTTFSLLSTSDHQRILGGG